MISLIFVNLDESMILGPALLTYRYQKYTYLLSTDIYLQYLFFTYYKFYPQVYVVRNFL